MRCGEGAGWCLVSRLPFWSTGNRRHSGLCNGFSLRLLVLIVPPDPVELGAPRTAEEEVDSKQVPVLRDYDQWVSGPDEPCGRQHCRLGGTEFFCRSSHISQTSSNQPPFKHWGPEENCFRTCRVVVERSQFGGQHVLDLVQDPVVGRSERSHGRRCSVGADEATGAGLGASSLDG